MSGKITYTRLARMGIYMSFDASDGRRWRMEWSVTMRRFRVPEQLILGTNPIGHIPRTPLISELEALCTEEDMAAMVALSIEAS